MLDAAGILLSAATVLATMFVFLVVVMKWTYEEGVKAGLYRDEEVHVALEERIRAQQAQDPLSEAQTEAVLALIDAYMTKEAPEPEEPEPPAVRPTQRHAGRRPAADTSVSTSKAAGRHLSSLDRFLGQGSILPNPRDPQS